MFPYTAYKLTECQAEWGACWGDCILKLLESMPPILLVLGRSHSLCLGTCVDLFAVHDREACTAIPGDGISGPVNGWRGLHIAETWGL